MDRMIVERKLYEILSLIELAQSDHPEDYNLDECHTMILQCIEEVE